jgi:hypothetical protein
VFKVDYLILLLDLFILLDLFLKFLHRICCSRKESFSPFHNVAFLAPTHRTRKGLPSFNLLHHADSFFGPSSTLVLHQLSAVRVAIPLVVLLRSLTLPLAFFTTVTTCADATTTSPPHFTSTAVVFAGVTIAAAGTAAVA